MQKDLGKDKIGSLLFKFSLPCVASLLISSLYNIVDQIFIGNSSLSYVGNAATGVVFPIIVVTQAFAWCFGDGCTSYLSICQGKKEEEKAAKAIGTGAILTVISSLLIMLVSFLFADQILTFCGASENSLPLAKTYLYILAPFFPFYMLQNMLNGIIRSDGSPLYAMLSTATGAVLNLILDPLFIFVFDWGIEGAAWATVIGQVVSFIVCAVYFFKPKTFKLTLKSFIPSLSNFKEPFLLGVSSFITQLSIVVINLVANSIVVRYGNLSKYGQDIPISITSIETKVYTLVLNLVVGIVLGGQPIIGYNFGAGNIKRIRHTYSLILIWTIGLGFLATLLFEIYPDGVLAIFGSTDNSLYMEYGRLVFRLFLATTILNCFIKMSSIFFQSCGEPIMATVSSLARDILFFIPAVIILPLIAENNAAGTGIIALLYAPMIADILAFIICLFSTFRLFSKLKKYENSIQVANS